MTTIAEVTALVDAHVSRDHTRFRAVALQIAANIESRSAGGAVQLRKLIEKHQAVSLTPLPSVIGLLSTPPDLFTLDDMVLSPTVRALLDRVVLEHSQRDVLSVHGLVPARKLLFTGLPGVGKTMAAGGLARAVGLPMFRVDLHGVIASHLGETAAKLAKVFEHVATMPAVYLFDEVDALAAERSNTVGSEAGGEMRRVVNSLLQFIEDDRSDSLIIAATNHASMLDAALFRRFDETIGFAGPTKEELFTLASRALIDVDVSQLDMAAIFAAVANPKLGHADVCAALDRVRKDHVLAETPIDTTRIVDALARRARVMEALS